MNTATLPPPSVPPPARTGNTIADHRAYNDWLEARQKRQASPETELRRARAAIDAALTTLSAGARKSAR